MLLHLCILLMPTATVAQQEPPIPSFSHAGRGSADAVKLLLARYVNPTQPLMIMMLLMITL